MNHTPGIRDRRVGSGHRQFRDFGDGRHFFGCGKTKSVRVRQESSSERELLVAKSR